MSYTTEHFNLVRLQDADSVESAAGRQALGPNFDRIDAALYVGTTTHRHRGNEAGPPASSAPGLSLNSTGGTLPGGNRIYYRYTLIDENGFEGVGSLYDYVDTDSPLNEPDAPSNPVVDTANGTLLSGAHSYVLSFYVDDNTIETRAINPLLVTIPSGTTTNQITFDLPDTVVGMTGFNVYRRRPGQSQYHYLTSIDTTVPVATFTDDGSIEDDCDRGLPTRNTTHQTWSVVVDFPESHLPDGVVAWKLYRSFDATNWAHSYISLIAGATPSLTFTDTGYESTAGSPPEVSQAPNPEKIALTDGQEVDGILAFGNTVTNEIVRFSFPGALEVQTGTIQWTCETPKALVLAARGQLGIGSVPDSQAVEFMVVKHTYGATPTSVDLFTTLDIGVDENQGLVYHPISNVIATLNLGDTLTCDLRQTGGGAETDSDLVVNVVVIGYGFLSGYSFDPDSDPQDIYENSVG